MEQCAARIADRQRSYFEFVVPHDLVHGVTEPGSPERTISRIVSTTGLFHGPVCYQPIYTTWGGGSKPALQAIEAANPALAECIAADPAVDDW